MADQARAERCPRCGFEHQGILVCPDGADPAPTETSGRTPARADLPPEGEAEGSDRPATSSPTPTEGPWTIFKCPECGAVVRDDPVYYGEAYDGAPWCEEGNVKMERFEVIPLPALEAEKARREEAEYWRLQAWAVLDHLEARAEAAEARAEEAERVLFEISDSPFDADLADVCRKAYRYLDSKERGQ